MSTKEKEKHAVTHPILKSFVAGSSSGTFSALLLQPLDLIKTRIQKDNIFTGNKSRGMLAVCRDVLHNENLFGLWKGLTPTLLRCVPGVGLYFCSLHTLQSNFGSANPGSLELLAMGATARSLSGITLLPFTVIKVRLESGLYRYSGVANALTSIYTSEGIRGLYSGMIATLVRDVPFSSLYLLFYTKAKRIMAAEQYEGSLKTALHLSCGIVAGTLASAVTQPADVIKTHMQTEKVTIASSVKHIHKMNGVSGFMSGFIPRTLRRTVMAALTWSFYEHISTLVGL